ncbi:pentatricopeptide repeat-containing protein 1, mitochondrial [Phlebotomus argentipes]|uniref:pentatricopeptide repeat-containing protein 1, mitochondrial n=1 Tax=Phlebotomus argentipes TaxID=94469 RepID=UPI0028935817|nr:pentatricopeptide repeat-containing protein 1, mitochondrial [Phlebotomus argentipes]
MLQIARRIVRFSPKRCLSSRSTFPRCLTKSPNAGSFAAKIHTTSLVCSQSERDFLMAQNNPDVFGPPTLTETDEDFEEPGDIAEHQRILEKPNRHHQLSTKQYADLIKSHIKNRRIKEAIDVVEERMIKEDKVKPENYIYNLLIGACGRLGYTHKAFHLYNRMKQRDLKVTGGTYTGLFNACAMSPWPADGLKRANRLRDLMLQKGYEPNVTNYNAMIKAYGRCGDIVTAFQLVDEMRNKKLNVDVITMNFLLQSCITDKELGFRHALLLWHKMRSKRLIPDAFSFNLLLRCVRDCGLGDLEATEAVIQQILAQSMAAKQKRLSSAEEDVEKGTELTTEADNAGTPPNLICLRPHLGSLVSLGEVTKAQDRLLLLGGISGFIEEMRTCKVTPDIKTFTELIEVIPSTETAEKLLLRFMKQENVLADIDFFNVLIKKRSMRFDYAGAKDVLGMIHTAKLLPDIVTYGVMALGCKTQAEAEELLMVMKKNEIRLNAAILGAMLKQGCSKYNFSYVMYVMDLCEWEQVKPNMQFVRHLLEFNQKCSQWKKHGSPHKSIRYFTRDLKLFQKKFDQWKTTNGLDNKSNADILRQYQEHPYAHFKTNQPGGYEEEKNPKLKHEKKLFRELKELRV